jgi:hypothetical protein
MAGMKVKDSNLFPMPGNEHLIHLGTITMGLREFVCMLSVKEHKVYIEEVVLTNIDFNKDVYAHCKFIEDDALAEDLAKFAEDKGLINVKERLNELIGQGKQGLLFKPNGQKF